MPFPFSSQYLFLGRHLFAPQLWHSWNTLNVVFHPPLLEGCPPHTAAIRHAAQAGPCDKQRRFMAVCLQTLKSKTIIYGRFPFPVISARPGVMLWVAYCGYPWFMCMQPFNAELPRSCFLHACFFLNKIDEFQTSQKLENCQQGACGSSKEKAAAGSTSPCGAPAVTSTSGGDSLRKNGIPAHELPPTWSHREQ